MLNSCPPQYFFEYWKSLKEYLHYRKQRVKYRSKVTFFENLVLQLGSWKSTLESFVAQLELKYKDSNLNLGELAIQLQNLQNDLTATQEKINALKTKIDVDFKAFDSTSTNENIKDYFDLKNEYTYDRTYMIFINQFVKQYTFLNWYNKKLLDTLINNKAALSTNSYVVIPDSGGDLLKSLNLLYDEASYKAQKVKDTNQ